MHCQGPTCPAKRREGLRQQAQRDGKKMKLADRPKCRMSSTWVEQEKRHCTCRENGMLSGALASRGRRLHDWGWQSTLDYVTAHPWLFFATCKTWGGTRDSN
eukprot:6481553-Amphidinium_carterae.1